MWKSSVSVALLVLTAFLLWGCGSRPEFVAKDEPWRKDQEMACLKSGYVRENRYLMARASLGSGVCGAIRPFEMTATANGSVQLNPPAMMVCDMVPAVEHWVNAIVQPAARAHLGQPIVELRVAASYSCRPMNNQSGGKLSEHGHANAIDIAAFRTADGRWITVKEGWSSWSRDSRFLKSVHQGGCPVFTTVLGPNANSNHRDHFHFDLARHGRDGHHRVCQ